MISRLDYYYISADFFLFYTFNTLFKTDFRAKYR